MDLLTRFQTDPRVGFHAFPTAKRSYLLGSNTYVIADEDLLVALDVVRQKQRAPPEERRGFAANPGAAFAERLAGKVERENPDADAIDLAEAIEERVSRLFIETDTYEKRTVDVGAWELAEAEHPPDPSHASPPEDTRSESPRIDAGSELIQPASEAGFPTSGVGRPPPEPPTTVTAELDVAGPIHQPAPRGDIEGDTPWPSRVRSSPFPHQLACFRWLVASWAAGQPGVLNADDQGLGKTLETLAFLAWLQDEMESGNLEPNDQTQRSPILVVAPTGLLRTWEAEVAQHLGTTGLFAGHRIYGPFLNEHRKPNLSGADTDDGRCRLHFDSVRTAIERDRGHRQWLLTTYQTLTNYQHSFLQLHFSTVVFDEIQMLKNPGTARAAAAMRVKADFRIGLTGTPIENRTTDLWAVMEAVSPGRLARCGTL